MNTTEANSAECLEHPVTGDALWFEVVLSDEDGVLVFRTRLPVGGKGTPLHLHTKCDETFEVLEGELAMVVGGEERRVGVGEKVNVPRGVVHRFWNASGAPVVFRGAVSPGREFACFLRAFYGLGREGRVGADGMPRNVLEVAVLREWSDLYFAGIPVWVQRGVFGVLSWLAAVVGVRGRMARFEGEGRRREDGGLRQRVLGLGMVLVPLAFLVFFTLLQMRFGYPDVLREPPGEVLEKFAAGGRGLVGLWGGMFLSALLFVGVGVGVGICGGVRGSGARVWLVVLGALAGLVQAMGFARWVFVVPWLAGVYLGGAEGGQTREAARVVFESLNLLMGVGVGETLGYAFTAAWTVVLGWSMRGERAVLGWGGVVLGVGIGCGVLETLAGAAWAGGVNAVAYTAWAVWLMVLGVICMGGRRLVKLGDAG